MGLFAPWFLGGLAAVGLPIWLHLLRKHRTVPLPFSSLMFFERRTQSSIKHRRLQYLLLFALRTAFLVLLVLAFAKPYVQRNAEALPSGRKLLVAAIDNSFSMRQGDRLARAKQQAVETLRQLRAEDRAQVLSINSQVQTMSDVSNDRSVLNAAVRAIEPTDARSSYAELARALRSIAQAAHTPVEAHLFSDMQKSSLPSSFADLRLGDGVRLVPHALAGQRQPNFTVEIASVPRRLYGSKKARVQATIAGFGTGRASRRVSLVLNGREAESKLVEVPASGRASVEFAALEAPYGSNRGEIRIDSGDAFPDDDRFYFSLERSDPRPALFIHEARNTRGLIYFRAALESSNENAFSLEEATPEQVANISPAKYAFVVLSDVTSVPAGFEEALGRYVRGGGSVLIALGRASAVRNRLPVYGGAIVETRYATREGERFQTVGFIDPAYPSFRKASQCQGVKFYQAIRIDPAQARVAARLSDETPLLLERQMGEGRVLVFASTFDNIANDFPLHASFVPFVEQTAHYLGRLDDRPGNFLVGSYFELRSGREQAVEAAALEVLDPKGARALSLAEATSAQNIQLAASGFYDVRRPKSQHELVAVNADRRESDLDVIPQETLALWQNTGQAIRPASGGTESERKPVHLWRYVMIAVLALAVVESWLSNRYLAMRTEAVQEKAA